MVWFFKRAATSDADQDAAEPASKRRRTEGGDSSSAIISQELTDVQLELQLLDERCAEEQISIQLSYDRKRREYFDLRAGMLRALPGFWRASILGHPAKLAAPAEVEALQYIADLDVRENIDRRGSFSVKFVLAENPLFNERELEKRVTFLDATSERVEAARLTAAGSQGTELLAAVARAPRSVFGWMLSSQGAVAGGAQEDFADVLRRDLWQDPIPYYMAYRDSPAAVEAGLSSDAAAASSAPPASEVAPAVVSVPGRASTASAAAAAAEQRANTAAVVGAKRQTDASGTG